MTSATEEDIRFIMDEIRESREYVTEQLKQRGVTVK